MWMEGEMYEHTRTRDLNKFIQYCDHGPRHCDDDDVSHLRGATMRISRTRTEQKIGPAWCEAARAAGEHQQILRARITQPHPLSLYTEPLTFNLHTLPLPCCIQSLRQNVAEYILSAKERLQNKTRSFRCLLSVSYSEKNNFWWFHLKASKKRDAIICSELYSSVRGHLLFVMTWHWRFTLERQMV